MESPIVVSSEHSIKTLGIKFEPTTPDEGELLYDLYAVIRTSGRIIIEAQTGVRTMFDCEHGSVKKEL